MASTGRSTKGTGFLGVISKQILLFLVFQCVTCKTLKYRVYEEQKVGTVIARLKEDVADVLAKFPGTHFQFRAMQRENVPFLSVQEEDGEISVATKIDREKLCEKNLNCSIEFDVVALPTEYLQLFHVEVEVLDINDNSPHFSRATLPIWISESASVGMRVPLDDAVDADVGDNSLHTYSLTPNKFFKIEVRTRLNGAKYAELVVMQELDREMQSSYQLQLTASDNGVPPKSGSTLLKISISDSNDNSPAFGQEAYVVELEENSPLGTLIIDLNATDPDEGRNGKIIYSFSAHVSPKIREMFKTNPDTGHVTLIKRVDYEHTASYELDIQAQDMGPNSIPGLCKVVVKVIDVNDNKPQININLMTTGKDEVAYISEAAPVDTFIALVRIDDIDTGLNGEVVCTLHGHGHFRLQKTHEKNYMILTNATLDREKRSEYSLTVIAEDHGSPSLSTTKHFVVKLLDENDSPPSFQKKQYEVFTPENNSPGTYIMQVGAVDPDLGTNSQLTYSILDTQIQGHPISTYFTIDPSSGAIYALRSLDHEDVRLIMFSIQVEDGGNPALSANTTVLLTVLDENDNPPVIYSPSIRNHTANLPIWRHMSPGQLITPLKVMDRDSGANGEFSCTITGGNDYGLFVMDPQQCELKANMSLENFTIDVVDLTVQVQDRGNIPLSTTFTIRLTLEESMDVLPPLYPWSLDTLDMSLVVIISLGSICAFLLIFMVSLASAHCSCEKRDSQHNYDSCVAENGFQNYPKSSTRQIYKTSDICQVPIINGSVPALAHPPTLPDPPTPDRISLVRGHSHLSLNSLVSATSIQVEDNYAVELNHITPPLEQVSQLLSILHHGQYHPRPSVRGNRYTRSFRHALNELDKFSLKDSGRGDSEAGDSDCEPCMESPMERLHGEDFSRINTSGCQYAVSRSCTEDCMVLGHSDQCWMPTLAPPVSIASAYHGNPYTPGMEAHWPSECYQANTQLTCSNITHTMSQSLPTLGYEGEEDDHRVEKTEQGINGNTPMVTEMTGAFQFVSNNAKDIGLCGLGFPVTTFLDQNRGHVVWPSNTQRQNPAQVTEQAGQVRTGRGHFLKPNKLHADPNQSAAGLSAGASAALQPIPVPLPAPSTKWLPAMEEIPEYYEEDDSGLENLQLVVASNGEDRSTI